MSIVFDRVWHIGFFLKPKSNGISGGQVLGLISSFLDNGLLWVVLNGKSLQGYHINASVSQGPILVTMHSLVCIPYYMVHV